MRAKRFGQAVVLLSLGLLTLTGCGDDPVEIFTVFAKSQTALPGSITDVNYIAVVKRTTAEGTWDISFNTIVDPKNAGASFPMKISDDKNGYSTDDSLHISATATLIQTPNSKKVVGGAAYNLDPSKPNCGVPSIVTINLRE